MGLSRSSATTSHPEKLTGVAGHFVLMRDGRVLWNHPLNKRVKNSQYDDAIQVEVEGNFQSERGKWWRGSSGNLPIHTLNPKQAVAIRKLTVLLEPYLTPNERGKFELTTHRMAQKNKPIDAGPEIWTAVANFALARNWELGSILGDGQPIPTEWWNYTATPVPGNA